ncbi:DUF2188 domain-containing protein [Rhizobium rhizogenes]|uniref:DUF2188 domain-containing protein n=1 Tax=Rhizobium rhizogenes TaxID=359 RepID=UPI0015740987|nr:DUF2188 domain-containing protein [Rhizobium rhizogenes]NTG01854.1 hypothetical protein [Rhizobium rhizogenes]NTG94234.1 hypothetical protein [Rhizobium rhizogenes]
MGKFWMVFGRGQGRPTYLHNSEQSALDEAKRLARLAPEVEFFVLETTHRVVKRDVDVTNLGLVRGSVFNADDIPF